MKGASSAWGATIGLSIVLAGAAEGATQSAWRAFPLCRDGLEKGQEIYLNLCEACHGAGVGKPGTAALQAKYRGRLPAVLTERADLESDAIRYVVRHGVSVMPFYRQTELSDSDLDALVRFLSRPSLQLACSSVGSTPP
jgi:mono/diheme cytochrome c family protein